MRAFSKYLAILIMVAAGALLRGQGADSNVLGDPAVAPGSPASSYALSGIDHINYYNGMVNTEIPVLGIGGRGSASQSITIPIQRQWGASNVSGSYAPVTNQWPILAGLYTSGYISIESVSATTDACYSNGQWQGGGPFVTYLVWTSFDGTQTFLKDTKSGGQEQGAGVNSCSALQSYTQYDRGRTFRSTDGSDLTFLSDNDIVDQGSNSISGALVTRDGTKMRFSADGYVSQIEDRNGNLINISWQSTANGGIYTFTDPVGRTSTINYTESLNSDTQDVITYPGYNGASRTIKVNYALLQNTLAGSELLATYHCLFPELNGATNATQFNLWVISSIVLADGTEYAMRYNAYGELAQLTLPTGGYYTYSYAEAGCSANGGSGVITLENNAGYHIWRPLRERDEYADGVHLSAKLVLSYPGGQSPDPNHPSRPLSEAIADFQDANSNILRQELHYFYGNPASTQAPPSDPVSFANWWEGLEAQTDITDGNYNVKQVQQQVYQQRGCGTGETCWFVPQDDTSPAHDPELCQTATTFDSSVTSGMLYAYDQFNNVTDKWEYDYGSAPGIGSACAAPASNYLRHTSTQYVSGSYTNPGVNLVSLPGLVTVDQGGTVASETHFGYDETSVANAPNVTGHDNVNYAGNGPRGNLTNPAQCLNPPNCSTWINHPVVYDIAGNVVSAADGNGNTTTFSYSDPNNTYAHPTTITNALGQSVSNQYDYWSGKLVAAMDLNGVNTLYSYNDLLERLTQVRRASGGGPSLESQTNYVYPNPNWAVAYQDQNSTGDGAMQTQSVYDGLGV